MSKILYFDCFSGISGDMIIGALLDLGVDSNYLIEKLSELNINSEYDIKIKKSIKNGITGTNFNVILKDDHDHHHDAHDNHTHHHGRHLKDIVKLIDDSTLNNNVKTLSKTIFNIIGEAEGKIHGKNKDEVHFHEVGGVDSIIDIVGAAICLDYFKVDKIYSSKINVGNGSVKCDHGIFPVPAPATSEILRGAPIKISSEIYSELTTPTGAGVIKAICDKFSDHCNFKIDKIAYGLGDKTFETHPNVLRVFLGEKEKSGDSLYLLETNIDNMNQEIYSYIMPKLFEIGVNDAYISNILMKKGRPGNMITVLLKENLILEVEEFLFNETTTLGIRKYKVERSSMHREIEEFKSSIGKVKVKKSIKNNKVIKHSFEYEDCKKIAEEKQIPLLEVNSILSKEYNK